MSTVDLFFLLRLLAALLLLLFLGLLGRLLWLDLRQSLELQAENAAVEASLRVVELGADDQSGLAVGHAFAIRPVTSIGRGAHCTVVIADSFASNQHALLTYRGTHWLLEDAGSRNGTLLNDIPVTSPVVVSGGDVIRIGDTALMLELAARS